MVTIDLLKKILYELENENFEMLNEATLQNEIAFKLKNQLDKNFTIQLEKNINQKNHYNKLLKRDMDIFIKNDKDYQACIEIKAPPGKSLNKRHTNTIKDIAFLEELKLSGFNDCFSLFITKHDAYKKHFTNKINSESKFYDGKKDFKLKKNYEIKWETINLRNYDGLVESYIYFILEI